MGKLCPLSAHIIFAQTRCFWPKNVLKSLGGPLESFWGIWEILFHRKNHRWIQNIVQCSPQSLHKIGPKTSTRGARPSLKQRGSLSSIRRTPQNPNKYLRTSGTPIKLLTLTAVFEIDENWEKNTRCLSDGKIMPVVRTYHFLPKLDAFDPKTFENHLMGF